MVFVHRVLRVFVGLLIGFCKVLYVFYLNKRYVLWGSYTVVVSIFL